MSRRVRARLLGRARDPKSGSKPTGGGQEPPAVRPAELGLVLGLSLTLLLAVGLAEAFRVYPAIERERLGSQGEIIKQALERFLQADLPLEQFPGFQPVAAPLLESDASLRRISVLDAAGRAVFVAGSDEHSKAGSPEILDSIRLPLESRFETAGELEMSMAWSVIEGTVSRAFLRLVGVGALAVIVAVVAFARLRRHPRSNLWLNVIFTATFGAVSLAMVLTLVALYSQGIRGKAKALAESLASRIEEPLSLGLELSQDLEGIERILGRYEQANADLSRLSLHMASGEIYTSTHASTDTLADTSAHTVADTVAGRQLGEAGQDSSK
ncbi:MAG: hypothetical protein AAF560_32155, partial [Acidobacteriota bacterium]